MPITGTLALVASAAMAGVPLLNGFLSKEMFFAETRLRRRHPVGRDGACPVAATLAGMCGVVYSLRFGYDIFFGPPSTDLPRAAGRAAALDARRRSSCWCSRASSSASRPRSRSGRCSTAAARPVVGGALPEYSLAVWHGFTRRS